MHIGQGRRKNFLQDVTPEEAIRQNSKCDRNVTVFGYVRGSNFKDGAHVHIAGVGDYAVQL